MPLPSRHRLELKAGDTRRRLSDLDYGDDVRPTSKARLADAVDVADGGAIGYLDNDGDGWQHRLVIEDRIELEPRHLYPASPTLRVDACLKSSAASPVKSISSTPSPIRTTPSTPGRSNGTAARPTPKSPPPASCTSRSPSPQGSGSRVIDRPHRRTLTPQQRSQAARSPASEPSCSGSGATRSKGRSSSSFTNSKRLPR